MKRPPGGTIVAVDMCKEALPAKEGYRCSRAPHEARSLIQSVQSAQMLVMDSSWQFDNLTQHSDQSLAVYFAAVALGKPTIGRLQYLQSSAWGPQDRALVLYRPVFRETQLSLHLEAKFKRESPLLCHVISGIVKMKHSLWKFGENPASAKACIQSCPDVRKFLLNHRRSEHAGGGILGAKSSLARPVP